MSTLRLEPARVGTLTAREGEGRWYGFDLQLAIYALSKIHFAPHTPCEGFPMRRASTLSTTVA